MPDLAILYEHPAWFTATFAALDARGVDYVALPFAGHGFDPAGSLPPAPLILNRLAMSSFLRSAEHALFYAPALFDHWQRRGARVLNGAATLAVDESKARQLSLIAGLGLAIPATRVVHRAADVVTAAAAMAFPLVVKANIGGSGAGIMRYDSLAELRAAAAAGDLPRSVDGVLLVQDFVPARDGEILRIETLGGRYLYAITVAGGGAFDLCPADACRADGARIAMTAADPAPALKAAAEAIARAAHLDIGGIELMIDDRDGIPRVYDVNALSNFVADPLTVLGWNPHARLVDYLIDRIAEVRA